MSFTSEDTRKKFVLIIELDRALGRMTLDSYTRELKDIAVVRKALNTDDAYALLINEFRAGAILVLGGAPENLPELISILKIATEQARRGNFSPVAIVANTGNEDANRDLLSAGCTISAKKKMDLPLVIRNYGASRVARDPRALQLR